MQNSKYFTLAEQAELVLSHQKDDYYLQIIQQQVADVFALFFGNQRASVLRKEFECISKLIYYTVTTLRCRQTLGEEYCNILEVDRVPMVIPNLRKRILLVLLETIAPYLNEGRFDRKIFSLNPITLNLAQKLSHYIPLVAFFMKYYIGPLHMTLFYLTGDFYHLSKRILGIRHIRTQISPSVKNSAKYPLLGILMLMRYLYSLKYDTNDSDISLEDLDLASTSLLTCPICLSNYRHPTIVPCGHIFCWSCLLASSNVKKECPCCRQQFLVQEAFPIYYLA